MNSGKIDLHSHTTYSDGSFPPADLVALARAKELKALAVTDHDTVAGLAEAVAAGEKMGVEVIPGIEISVDYSPGTMHILGYFIDYRSNTLSASLKEIQGARNRRNPEIAKRLKALGVPVTMEEASTESGEGQVGRPHFAQVLVKKGFARDHEEAFEKFLKKGAPAYVEKRRVLPEEGIRIIEEAGGIASLAHPNQLGAATEEEFYRIFDKLITLGLKGIEAFSSCQTEAESAFYQEAGRKRGVFVTGGSDFHGALKPDVGLGEMGKWASLDYGLVEAMKKFIGKKGTV